jgi:hypothetical protein
MGIANRSHRVKRLTRPARPSMILVAVMVVWSWTSTAGAQAPGQESFVQHVSGDSPTTLYIKQPSNRHARTSAIQQKILQPKTTARLFKVQSDEALDVQLSGQDLLAPERLQAPNEKNPSLGTPSPYDQVFLLPPPRGESNLASQRSLFSLALPKWRARMICF